MFTVYPYAELGHANHGWLDARHHFSFSGYYNPARRQFGQLRVINDDTIAAGSGFDTHPHDNMEIITYVRAGAITHRDSMGNEGRTEAGDVQVMSAGSGVEHSEHNHEDVATRLYQIWIIPNARDVAPYWAAQQFPKTPVTDALPLLVSGQPEHAGQGALPIHQDAAIYGGRLCAGTELVQPVKHQAYLLVAEGRFTIEGASVLAGDGAEFTGGSSLRIRAEEDGELLVIDVPA